MYNCFSCNREIKPDQLRKRVRCIYCGSKIIYKGRTNVVKIQAR